MKHIFWIFLLVFCIYACSQTTIPAQSTIPADAPTETHQLNNTATPEPVQPTPTTTATAIPTPSYPLGISDPLPQLTPISTKNVAGLIPIASFNSAQINNVTLNDKQDKIIFTTIAGIQMLDLATFSTEPYKPLSGASHLTGVSTDGRLAAELLFGNPMPFDMKMDITDLSTGKVICSLGPVKGQTDRRLVFPDNRTLSYIGSDWSHFRIVSWNLFNCETTFDQTTGSPGYTLSKDGKFVAWGENSKLFIYPTNGESKKLLLEDVNLLGAYFLPDDKSILVTFKAGNAIYDIASGKKIADFPGNMSKFWIRYQESLDGEWLFIQGDKINRALKISENKLYTLPSEIWGNTVENGYLITTNFIWSLNAQRKVAYILKYGAWLSDKKIIISPNGAFAAISPVASPSYVDIIDLSNGKVVYTIKDFHNPVAIKDGFIATSKGQTGFFDYSSDQPLKLIDLKYTGGVILKNGNPIVWDDFGQVSQVDPTSQSIIHSTQLSFLQPEAPIYHLAPAWKQVSDDFLASFMNGHTFYHQTLSHDRKISIQQTNRGLTQIFKVNGNGLIGQVIAPADIISTTLVSGNAVEYVFSPDDHFVAGIFQSKITIWDVLTGKQIQKFDIPIPPWRMYGMAFSPDGSKLLVSNSSTSRKDMSWTLPLHLKISLRVYEVASGKLLKNYTLEQEYQKSGCNIGLPFVVTSDGTQIITLTNNCKIGVFDLNTWELKQELGEPISNANIDLALSPDNHLLAVAYKGYLDLWDMNTGTMVKRNLNPANLGYLKSRDADWSVIHQVAFSPDGSFIGTRFGTFYQYNSLITLWGVKP